MNSFIRPCLLAVFVAGSAASQAAVLAGAATNLSIDNFATFRTTGGNGVAAASDTLPDSGAVKAKGNALLSATDGLPVLKVFAESFAGERNGAGAAGVQKYQYMGSATTLTVNGLFEGVLTPDVARYFGEMVIFNEEEAGFGEDDLAAWFDDNGDFGGLIFEGILPGQDGVASQSANNSGPFSDMLSVSLDVEDGDVFWFYANFFMSADGVGSGTAKADGFTTATFSFADGTGVSIVGPTAIPVPAAAWLLLSGLGVLVSRQRRS